MYRKNIGGIGVLYLAQERKPLSLSFALLFAVLIHRLLRPQFKRAGNELTSDERKRERGGREGEREFVKSHNSHVACSRGVFRPRGKTVLRLS